MRPQAGVGRLKPTPALQANGSPLVAQAVSPANYIFSQLFSEWSHDRSAYRVCGWSLRNGLAGRPT